MEQRITEAELFRSCEILFGTDLNFSREFLEYLQAGGIKSAYRKRAMETHPDRLIGRGLTSSGQKSGEEFHAVQEAYAKLLSFLETKNSGPIPGLPRNGKGRAAAVRRNPVHPHPSGRDGNGQNPGRHCGNIKPIVLSDRVGANPWAADTDSLFRGPLPERHLLFGHFLYYSGLTNWRTIARILTWQRTERPRLGELARRFGMCRQDEVIAILQAKRPCRPFGETARRLGMLTEHQVRVLVFHQQRLQKKFGTILFEKQLISQPELEELLDRFELHNATVMAQ
jgi:hypothetical protein